MRIKRLDPVLANQIAAGEVIDRPAAVLKELVENALDAAADDIQVDIEQGGVQKILVRDNGVGIEPEDLRLAFERHTTSKLETLNDLFALNTLGFRGEALAAISSVTKMRIASKTNGREAAVIECVGGKIGALLPVAHPVGTTVEVNDLFFNTPVRRRFLRSEKTETLQLEEIFKRLVLSHFGVGFSWKSSSVSKSYPKASTLSAQKARVAKILGKKFITHSVYIDVSRLGLRLWGWIGLPECARKQPDNQYFFVNHRVVKDRLLNHAMKTTFLQLNPVSEGSHPSYVLYLDISSNQVDVNVHPTKLEVRFSESRLVHDFIYFAVNSAFKQSQDYFTRQESRVPMPLMTQIYQPADVISSSIRKRYELFESREIIYLIDWHYALKPMSYEFFIQKILKDENIGKPLLFPKEISLEELGVEDENILVRRAILEKLGISFNLQADKMFCLSAPEGLNIHKLPSFFKKWILLEPKVETGLALLLDQTLDNERFVLSPFDIQNMLEKWNNLEDSGFAYPIHFSDLSDFFNNKAIQKHPINV
ncbi:MAG: DNA mismatch repair endonuclease MutL [Gammaproteobacteria bacterium]